MTQFRCCNCARIYTFALMVSKKGDDPLIQCPGCRVVHSVNFEESKYEPIGPIEELKLKSYWLDAVCDSDLASDDAGPGTTWVTEDRVDHTKTEYVWIGVRIWNGDSRDPAGGQVFTLRVKQDGGSWFDLGGGTGPQSLDIPGTGNMVYTDLTPPNADWFCTTACGVLLEVDGVAQDNSANLTAPDVQEDYEIELWWGMNPTNGADSSVYTFALTDDQGNFSDTLLAASLTLAGAALEFQAVGGGAMAIAGGVIKKTARAAGYGGHTMAIVGGVSKKTIRAAGYGGHAMSIAGVLGTQFRATMACGGHAMTITQALVRLPKKLVGGHAMVITQALIKKTPKAVGGYAMTITGALGAVFRAVQTAGGHATSIVGSLATSYIPGGAGVVKSIRALLLKVLR